MPTVAIGVSEPDLIEIDHGHFQRQSRKSGSRRGVEEGDAPEGDRGENPDPGRREENDRDRDEEQDHVPGIPSFEEFEKAPPAPAAVPSQDFVVIEKGDRLLVAVDDRGPSLQRRDGRPGLLQRVQ